MTEVHLINKKVNQVYSMKALLDALYLMSLGRYRLDLSAVDFGRLNRDKLARLLALFPPNTEKLLRRYDHTRET